MYDKIRNPLLALLGKKVNPPNPIEWRFKPKKTSFNTCEVHITAMIEHPWRLYSQESAVEGPMPTSIQFEENTFLHPSGELEEHGNVHKAYNQHHDITTYYCTSVVDHIQNFHVFTNPQILKGKIYYTPCNEKSCLSRLEKEFQIELT
jgi:thiol:disulfide interchange protein DsbD